MVAGGALIASLLSANTAFGWYTCEVPCRHGTRFVTSIASVGSTLTQARAKNTEACYDRGLGSALTDTSRPVVSHLGCYETSSGDQKCESRCTYFTVVSSLKRASDPSRSEAYSEVRAMCANADYDLNRIFGSVVCDD